MIDCPSCGKTNWDAVTVPKCVRCGHKLGRAAAKTIDTQQNPEPHHVEGGPRFTVKGTSLDGGIYYVYDRQRPDWSFGSFQDRVHARHIAEEMEALAAALPSLPVRETGTDSRSQEGLAAEWESVPVDPENPREGFWVRNTRTGKRLNNAAYSEAAAAEIAANQSPPTPIEQGGEQPTGTIFELDLFRERLEFQLEDLLDDFTTEFLDNYDREELKRHAASKIKDIDVGRFKTLIDNCMKQYATPTHQDSGERLAVEGELSAVWNSYGLKVSLFINGDDIHNTPAQKAAYALADLFPNLKEHFENAETHSEFGRARITIEPATQALRTENDHAK
jgi:hypothetical protein